MSEPGYESRPESTSRASSIALLLLRVGAAIMLIYFHGFDKAAGAYAHVAHGQDWPFAGFIASLGFPLAKLFALCAALAESLGAALLVVGLFTRYASAAVAFTMLVAVYFHASTDMQVELAAMYLLVALTFVFVSPGPLSADAWVQSRSRRAKATPEASGAAA
jgi:putative oxidoreductase